MSEYKGKMQRGLEKLVVEEPLAININWLAMSKNEALKGGADRCTDILLAAGYKPVDRDIAPELRQRYVSGEKDESGNYIRIPRETWTKVPNMYRP